MKFQQYTTFAQSEELKSLGAEQEDPNRSPADQLFHARIDDPICTVHGHERASEVEYVRAFTLQEMLHELMAHYQVDVLTQPRESTVWLFTVAVDPDVVGSFSVKGDASIRECTDPFLAVYKAFKWHLSQKESSTPPTT